MDFRSMKRDGSRVHSAVGEVGNDLVAKETISAILPEKYVGGYLGSIEDEIRVIGVFALVLEEAKVYANALYLSYVTTEPSQTNIITVNGDKYLKFTYQPGDKIIKGLDLVRVKTLVFRAYNNFIANGRIPPYLDLVDMSTMFSETEYQANVDLRVDNAIMELFAASIARDPKNRMEYFRHLSGTKRNQYPDFIPLGSVAYGATNTFAKLQGAYFSEGLSSALVHPSESVESIEDSLRK